MIKRVFLFVDETIKVGLNINMNFYYMLQKEANSTDPQIKLRGYNYI